MSLLLTVCLGLVLFGFLVVGTTLLLGRPLTWKETAIVALLYIGFAVVVAVILWPIIRGKKK